MSWNYIGENTAPTTFPKKDDGYQVTDVACTNGDGTWNNNRWAIELLNMTSSTQCTVTFDDIVIYQDNSGANPPELIEGLIPVAWNGSNWVKADTSTEWYNYDEQWWANAVTVTSASRSEYMNASANTIISMEDIETMWVWIPRYSYTIKSEDGTNYYGRSMPEVGGVSPATRATPGVIDIKFVDINTKELGTAQYTGDNPIEWRTPDGFTFGTQELPGIWVAKFETSSTNPNASAGGGNTTNYDPIVKPNVINWRDINVSNAFTVSRKLTAEGNRYGLDTNADGHMMKNSEWGLVAYLSQSKYGKYGNEDYLNSNKRIYRNNSSGRYTGKSIGFDSTNSGGYTNMGSYDYYEENTGTGASTTGTIYGVYDMSGGAWEYTMSNYNGTISSAGFSSLPDSKYYDRYTSTTALTACNGGVCYGHALSETTGWGGASYSNVFMTDARSWLYRGSLYGITSIMGGPFEIGRFSGGNSVDVTFRLVLAPAP